MVEVAIIREVEPSLLCNREPIRVHPHIKTCSQSIQCVLNVLVLSCDFYWFRVPTKLSSGGVAPPFAWLAPLFQL